MMTSQRNSLESDATVGPDERRDWPGALLLGMILGAVVAVVAGILRRPPAAEKLIPPDLRHSVQQPKEGSTPGTIRPVPVPVAGQRATSLPEPEPELAQPVPPRQAPVPKGREPATPPLTPPVRFKEPTKYVVGVGLALAAVLILVISRSVIPLIIIAALLALVVQPVIGFFQRRLKLSKGLSIALTYLLVVVLLLLIPLVVVPLVVEAVNDLVNIDFQSLIAGIEQVLQDLSTWAAGIPILNAVLVPFLNTLTNAFQGITASARPAPVSYDVTVGGIVSGLADTLGAIAQVLGPIVSAVVSLVFTLLISFYLTLSGKKMLAGYPRFLPPALEPEITALIQRIGDVWVAFIRGQLALMVIVGTMVWLGNAILGNNYAFFLGVISGTLEIIPNLGPALALIPGVGMALLFGSSHFSMPNLAFALIVLGLYLLVQVLENQVIVPYVLGGAVELSPLVVILGVMIGGTVAGILGVLLSTPIIATGREIFGYLYDKILEPPLDEIPPEEKPSLLDSVLSRLQKIRLPFGRRREQASVPDREIAQALPAQNAASSRPGLPAQDSAERSDA
jgi:predicted PurR-regulated permease PerM